VCGLCRGVLIAWGVDQTLLYAHIMRQNGGLVCSLTRHFWARKGRKKRRKCDFSRQNTKKKRVSDRQQLVGTVTSGVITENSRNID